MQRTVHPWPAGPARLRRLAAGRRAGFQLFPEQEESFKFLSSFLVRDDLAVRGSLPN